MVTQRIREPLEATGTITLREAARKYERYGANAANISRWLPYHENKVAQQPASPGDRLYLDEASLRKRLAAYTPHRDNQGRKTRRRTSEHSEVNGANRASGANGNGHTNGHSPATPIVSQSPRPFGGRASQNPSGSGPTTADGPVLLDTREWRKRFYQEQRRSMGGDLRRETEGSYDWVFDRFQRSFQTLPMERRIILEYLHAMTNLKTGGPISAGSKQLALRVLQTFYHWLGREHGYSVPDLTHANLPTPSSKKAFYTQDDIRLLLQHVRSAEERTFIVVMAQTGCRRGELCSVTWDNLHDHWALCYGKPTRANQTGERVLYLPDEAYDALYKHLQLFRRMTWRGQPLDERQLTDFTRWLAKQAGISEKGQNTHAFRRGYEAEFLRNGGDSMWMDEILGHRKVDMRSLYFNVAIQECLEQAQKYAPRRFLQPTLPMEELPEESAL